MEDQGIDQRAIVCQILIQFGYNDLSKTDNFNKFAVDRIISLDLEHLPKVGDIITYIDDILNVTNWHLKKGGIVKLIFFYIFKGISNYFFLQNATIRLKKPLDLDFFSLNSPQILILYFKHKITANFTNSTMLRIKFIWLSNSKNFILKNSFKNITSTKCLNLSTTQETGRKLLALRSQNLKSEIPSFFKLNENVSTKCKVS